MRAFYLVAFVLLSSLIVPEDASAHIPIYPENNDNPSSATRIPDIAVSYASYATLGSSPDYYSFDGKKGQEFYLEMLVPALSGLEDFAPAVALAGPAITGLEKATFDLPSGYGTMVFYYNGTENVLLGEPFTQTAYWERQTGNATLPSDGKYYIVVFEPRGNSTNATGKYTMVTGLEEQYTLADDVQLPIYWLRTRIFFGDNMLLTTLPMMLVVIIGAALYAYGTRGMRAGTRAREYAIVGVVGILFMFGFAVNQLLLLGVLTTMTGFESEFFIGIAFQAAALAIGTLSSLLLWAIYRRGALSFASLYSIAVLSLAIVALVIGTGFIVGPILFAVGAGLAIVHFTTHRARVAEAS